MNKHTKHALSALVLASVLAACGGGGADQSAGPVTPEPTTPVATASMVTTVSTPAYAEGSEELAAFHRLNAERLHCGFGALKQDARLDQAALAHADWMLIHNRQTHYEDPLNALGFTGVYPWDRAMHAGYPSSVVGEGITFGLEGTQVNRGERGIRELLAGAYHAIGLLKPMRDVGISVRTGADVGRSTLVVPTEIVMGAAEGFQLQTTDGVVTYPCEGSTGVESDLGWEEPNPVPGRHLQTQPLGSAIVVMVRYGHTLILTSADMVRVSDSQQVVMRAPVTGAADPNGLLVNDPHIGYVIPESPLNPGTAYRVTLRGTNNGTSFERTFTFRTGP